MFNLTTSFHLLELGSVCGVCGECAVCAQVFWQISEEGGHQVSFLFTAFLRDKIYHGTWKSASNHHSSIWIFQSRNHHIPSLTQIFNQGVENQIEFFMLMYSMLLLNEPVLQLLNIHLLLTYVFDLTSVWLSGKISLGMVVVVDTFSPSTREAEIGRSLSSYGSQVPLATLKPEWSQRLL